MSLQTIQQLIPIIRRGNTKANKRNIRSMLRQDRIHSFDVKEIICLMNKKGSKIYNSALKPLFIKHLEKISTIATTVTQQTTTEQQPVRIKGRRNRNRKPIERYREPKEGEIIDTSNKFLEISDLEDEHELPKIIG